MNNQSSSHSNSREIVENDALYSHFLKPRQSPQRIKTQQQAAETNPPSLPEQKPKEEYAIHYHSPGQEFTANSQSQGNIVVFPKTEGQGQGLNEEDLGNFSCSDCGNCYDCRMKRSGEEKEQKSTCCEVVKVVWYCTLLIHEIFLKETPSYMSYSFNAFNGEKRENPQNQKKNRH